MRGAELSMIFQEPMTALNPVYTIGSQMNAVLRRHEGLSRRAARARSIEMLERVGIPVPARRIDEYPHELSGGMRQRAMIAMALSCRPRLLIADEPTTALDVTTQAQVLAQIADLQKEMGTAVILVTHDLGVVAETCHEALVMYCGQIVEQAPVGVLFESTQASLHRRAHRRDSADSAAAADPASGDPGHCARPGRAATRLPLCRALRFCR